MSSLPPVELVNFLLEVGNGICNAAVPEILKISQLPVERGHCPALGAVMVALIYLEVKPPLEK